MRKRDAEKAFLDGPAARLIAALVILLCGALLAYVHRDDLRPLLGTAPDGESEAASDDPAAPCIAQRFGEIDGMVEDGVIDGGQADLFKQRAEAMCRATEGEGGGPPLPLPKE